MTFIAAIKAAAEDGKKVRPKDANLPYMFYDKLGFQWRYVDGGIVQTLPTPDQFLGEWESLE